MYRKQNKIIQSAGLQSLLVLLFLMMAAVSPVNAGPASPDTLTLTNPDGTTFKANLRGDEFQNWIEAEDGYTVVKNNSTGYWEYAEKAADGSLVNSGVIYKPGFKAPAGVRKGLKPEKNKELESFHKQMLKEVYQERTSSAADLQSAALDWPPVPVSGAKKVLIILINFADRALITTASGWYDKIFNTAAGVKSMANFYYENSYGLMSVSPAAHSQSGNPTGIITVTVSDNHPNYGSNYIYATETTILNHALAQASPYIDFAGYDSNGNGILEQSELNIYFIYAGYEASGTNLTPNVWAHAWGGTPGITAGTKQVRRWAQNGELNNNSVQHPMGVIAHEMGHSLCGMADLYDIASHNSGLGIFSLMASGSWGGDTGEDSGTTPVALDTWSRQYVGWATPLTPSGDGNIYFPTPLSSQSSSYKFVYPEITDSEYFLAENRYPTGWDLGMKKTLGSGWAGGLLIIHVDTNIGTPGSNDINKWVSGSHQGVMAEEASSVYCSLVANTSCRGHATILFYSGNNDAFTDSTTPNTKYYNGSSTGLGLSSISAPGTTMTALYSYTEPSAPTVIFNNGFESGGWYAQLITGSTAAWYYATNSAYPSGITPYSGTYMAVFNSYDASSGEQSRLYSDAAFAISSSYDSVTLSFWIYHDAIYTNADTLQPQISIDGGSSWANLGSPVYRYDGTSGWAQVSLDMSSYLGQSSVLIGFLGTSAYGNDIHLDDVLVTGTSSASNKVLIGASNYYSTLTAAYAAASTGNVIKARNLEFAENLLCIRSINITIDGGYQSGFSAYSGNSTLNGSLTIRGGSVTASRLLIK